ncbi:hypothetical protein D3C81_1898940 [compost metagenome]
MLGVALRQAGLAQAQLVMLGAKLQGAVPQHGIALGVVGCQEFDLDALGPQWLGAET